jgi:hypothetical protein
LIVTTAILSVGIFVVAFALSGVGGAAAGVLATTQATMAVMRDATLDDAARERAVQRSSLKLVSDFVSIFLRGGLSLAASLLPIWLMDVTGLVSARAVIGFLSRLDVIAGTTIVMVLGYVAWTRVWRSS